MNNIEKHLNISCFIKYSEMTKKFFCLSYFYERYCCVHHDDVSTRWTKNPYIEQKPGFIYLICVPEFQKNDKIGKLYKIGKTIDIKNIKQMHPNGSQLHLCYYCITNIDTIEKRLISSFDDTFSKRINMGTNHYEGDVSLMIPKMMYGMDESSMLMNVLMLCCDM